MFKKVLISGLVLFLLMGCVSAINKSEYSLVDYEKMSSDSSSFNNVKLYVNGTVDSVLGFFGTGTVVLVLDDGSLFAVYSDHLDDYSKGERVVVYGTGSVDFSRDGYSVPSIDEEEVVFN